MMLLLSVLIIIVCVLLILIVLVQNPKGGGLSSSFGGGGTQLFGGVKKTTDFLDKGTWALAIALVVLVLTANVMNKANTSEAIENKDSAISEQLDGGAVPAPITAPAPVQEGGGTDLPEPVSED